jgi:hypothetical protein
MTYQRNHNGRGQTARDGDKNKPTHIVKQRHGTGKSASYERIGVAWLGEEDGSLYVRLHGTQIISGGFTCYELEDGKGGAR